MQVAHAGRAVERDKLSSGLGAQKANPAGVGNPPDSLFYNCLLAVDNRSVTHNGQEQHL
ncbi:MAG: hypothetical protein R2911_43380 [Caldilineaceae bacterium]